MVLCSIISAIARLLASLRFIRIRIVDRAFRLVKAGCAWRDSQRIAKFSSLMELYATSKSTIPLLLTRDLNKTAVSASFLGAEPCLKLVTRQLPVNALVII
jgi:hypothetical protein